jgi:hypothetical protein
MAFAIPPIKVKSNGYWHYNSTWDMNRLPCGGDTIVIPADKTVTINNDQQLNGTVYLKIYGRLNFVNNNSTLHMAEGSTVVVYTNGQVLGGGSASQKLRIGSVAVFKGNDAPVNGPQMATASSNGFESFNEEVFPVKFVGFTLSRKNSNSILIQWSTSEEMNAHMYEVERSYTGSEWNTIAYVSAIGNSNALNNYTYTDKNISSRVVYYRIRQVDVDERFTYTDIKSVKTENIITSQVKIASVQGKVLLQFPEELKGNLVVRMVSLNGQVMDQQVISNPVGQFVLQSNLHITGNYIVSVSNGQEINIAKQVIL